MKDHVVILGLMRISNIFVVLLILISKAIGDINKSIKGLSYG